MFSPLRLGQLSGRHTSTLTCVSVVYRRAQIPEPAIPTLVFKWLGNEFHHVTEEDLLTRG
ncbi:MAG TPA: hypothetical protein VN724_00260 [Pyrinomonadaceae bacterium]|nr:hypothetical protein [Pyrinomonadaceae bacterium]